MTAEVVSGAVVAQFGSAVPPGCHDGGSGPEADEPWTNPQVAEVPISELSCVHAGCLLACLPQSLVHLRSPVRVLSS